MPKTTHMTPATSLRLIITGLEGLLQYVDGVRGPEQKLSRRDITRRIGISIATLNRRISKGEFPGPDLVDGAVHRWSESTVTAWEAQHQRPGG